MPGTIVVGLVYGDEGKGRVCDFLAKEHDCGCRFNGGPNSGHTVVVGDRKYVTHLLPATVLYPNKISIIGPGVAVDFTVLAEDMEAVGAGTLDNSVLIDKNCAVITSGHRDADAGSNSQKIGTTGRGVGPCFADQVNRTGSRYKDLVDEKHHIDTSLFVQRALRRGKSVLFEGAQGFLLDNIHGTYPFVTSCSTLAGSVYSTMGIDPRHISSVVGVFKAYTTRVGNGPFPTELKHAPLTEMLRAAGNEYGATTGRPRRIGWLDLPELSRACRMNAVTSLVMTKADVLSGMTTVLVCEKYEDGLPVFREMEGWSEDISNIRRYKDLPDNLKKFIDLIERKVNRPITLISVGAERQQMCKGS